MRRESSGSSVVHWRRSGQRCSSRPRSRARRARPASSSREGRRRAGRCASTSRDTDFEYIDPALAYDTTRLGDDVRDAACMLVNYPDKHGAGGSAARTRRRPQAFPTVSKDGKTYMFTVKPGLKFSDGSPVTAAAFAARARAGPQPEDGVAGGVTFVSGHRRRAGRPRRQGADGLRRHGEGPDADHQADEGRPDFLASWRCSSSRPSSRTCRIDADGRRRRTPSAGPYYIKSA